MGKLYMTSINKRNVVQLAIIVVITICVYIANLDSDIVLALMWNHYPTLVLNSALIIFCYMKYMMVNEMYTIIITRMKRKKVLRYSIQFGIVMVIMFSLIFYISGFLVYGAPIVGEETLFLTFICLNTICFFIEQCILLLQMGRKKSIVYIISALALNFLFHYALLPLIFAN